MIPPHTKQFLAALLLAAVLLLPQGTLSAPSRTEAYGIVMTDDAKQLYMREKMQAFYRGTVETTPLTLPEGWTAEHEVLGGVPVTLTVYPGMPHDFALIFPELADSSASLQEIADFVEKYMKEDRPRLLLRGEDDAVPESEVPHE